FLALVLGLSVALSLQAQSQAHLQTTDVTLVVEASADAPRLARVFVPGQSPWINRAAEVLPENAEVGGQSQPLRWKLNARESHSDRRNVSFVYEASSPHLKLTWEWQGRADYGPVEHQIRIENLSQQEIWLPFQDSFRFDFLAARDLNLKHFFVEKGADSPSSTGTHDVPLDNGYSWQETSSTYAHPAKGEAREIIPWFLVQRMNSSRDGWYV